MAGDSNELSKVCNLFQ